MTNHLTYEQCAIRYPRLVRCMQYVAILNQSEAACALRDWRDGITWGGGEAVSHYGGIKKVLDNAIYCRHYVLRELRGIIQ